MKNISVILLLLALFAGTSCIAIQAINIEEQKAVNENMSGQYHDIVQSSQNESTIKFNELVKRYTNDLRTCVPAHFDQILDLFGLKISFSANINGWIDNKCSYSFTGKIHSVGKDIREVYNINFTDEDISKIEPTIKCDFTQEQLNILIDGLLASSNKPDTANSKKSAEKSVANIYNSLTPEERKAVEMLMTSGVCTVPNSTEVIQQYMNLNSMP